MSSKNYRYSRLGGTLIEVLVSLVIIAMVAASVLDVAAKRRAVLSQAAFSSDAMNLALLWRSSNQENEEWARGESGGFPGRNDSRWFLENAAAQVTGSGPTMDNQWRRLHVVRLDRGSDRDFTVTFRLEDPKLTAGEIR